MKIKVTARTKRQKSGEGETDGEGDLDGLIADMFAAQPVPAPGAPPIAWSGAVHPKSITAPPFGAPTSSALELTGTKGQAYALLAVDHSYHNLIFATMGGGSAFDLKFDEHKLPPPHDNLPPPHHHQWHQC